MYCVYRTLNITDQIFAVIKDMVSTASSGAGGRTLKVTDVNERCVMKGFRQDQVDACLEEYEELNVWQLNQARSKITFI